MMTKVMKRKSPISNTNIQMSNPEIQNIFDIELPLDLIGPLSFVI